jgi:transcriptional regulator GlxA family with amidase domain
MGTAKIVSTSEIAAAQSFRHDQGSAGTTQRAERYRQIVNHFEQVARANVGTFVQVADLSRIAEINQRTLSRAFREIRGMGPYRYVQCLRLIEVRRILLSEGKGTVTQAAMRFGFREVGKFGVLYRKAFGETPSQTRRRRQSVSPHDTPLVPNETEEIAPCVRIRL